MGAPVGSPYDSPFIPALKIKLSIVSGYVYTANNIKNGHNITVDF